MATGLLVPTEIEVRHFHLFCGLGGGARGFNRGQARVGHARAKYRCIGGIDNDKAGIADFERLAQAKGTVLDLFSREQYEAFHGRPAPADYREATPADIQRAAGYERPHIGFGSAPCKGFSGLLSESRSKSGRYQALNQLALRGLWLALEAWKDDPVEFWLWENVPRIATRGRSVLDQMIRLLEAYGYAVAETTHDCGELGGLAQSRKRFLLVARHREKVPPFLYEPPKRPLRAVGDVLGKLPLPSDPRAGAMHRMRSLQMRTWVRLAFVEAGSDWRSLKKLRVENGVLKDYALVPDREWYRTALGVQRWDEPAGTITSEARPQNGAFSVADPRPTYTGEYSQLGVNRWEQPVGAVSGQSAPGGGAYSVADPRYESFGEHYGKMRVEPWDQPSHTVTGSDRVGSGALSVADPRPASYGGGYSNLYRIVAWDEVARTVCAASSGGGTFQSVADPRASSEWEGHGKYTVTPFNAPTNTVIGASATGNGAYAVADPRSGIDKGKGDDYLTARHYGVLPWDSSAQSVTASACHDNGMWSVADPRGLPHPDARLVAIIRALDGTWHRPFTTLELAFLQSLLDIDEYFEFNGASDTAWRERIGNAVPSDAAQAIASVMGETLLLAWSGETFLLSSAPVWVRPFAVGVSVNPFSEVTS